MGFTKVIEAGVCQLMFQRVTVEPLLLDCYRKVNTASRMRYLGIKHIAFTRQY